MRRAQWELAADADETHTGTRTWPKRLHVASLLMAAGGDHTKRKITGLPLFYRHALPHRGASDHSRKGRHQVHTMMTEI